MKKYCIYTIVIAIICGFVSAHSIFERSYTAILFWAVIGLLIGLWTMRNAVRNIGLLYGFFLMFAFLLFGYQGDRNHMIKFVLLSVGLSMISAFCGWLVVFIGSKLRLKFKK